MKFLLHTTLLLLPFSLQHHLAVESATAADEIRGDEDQHLRQQRMEDPTNRNRLEMYRYHGILPDDVQDNEEGMSAPAIKNKGKVVARESRRQPQEVNGHGDSSAGTHRRTESKNRQNQKKKGRRRRRKRQRSVQETVQEVIARGTLSDAPSDAPSNVPTEVPTSKPISKVPRSHEFTQADIQLPGKKGIGFTMRDPGEKGSWVDTLPFIQYLKPYWNYSWGYKPCPIQPADIEWVPMMWGRNYLQQRINDYILPLVEDGTAKRILGFNEPGEYYS